METDATKEVAPALGFDDILGKAITGEELTAEEQELLESWY